MTGTSATLHVYSSRVCIDGDLVPAVVGLDPDGRVRSIQQGPPGDSSQVIDVGAALVVPAPLDLHLHGGGGADVPPQEPPSSVDRALRASMTRISHAALPAPTRCEWLATLPLPTRAAPALEPQLETAAAMVAAAPASGCVGLRLEGAFLNPVRAGVWPHERLLAPDPDLLEALHDAALAGGARLRIVDVAPELDGAIALIERARELGIIVSLAHTDATWEQAQRAIHAGATLATHTWNAMRPLAHRDPGVIAAVLTNPRVTCELICDGVHLHPGTIALSVAAAGRGGWCAISDASPLAGLPAGTYRWADVDVVSDGSCLRSTDGSLAGSAALLDRAPGVLRAAGVGELDAALALGAVPRQVLEPARTLGLAQGDPAWVVATD